MYSSFVFAGVLGNEHDKILDAVDEIKEDGNYTRCLPVACI